MEGLREGSEGEKEREERGRENSKLQVLARKLPELHSLEVLSHPSQHRRLSLFVVLLTVHWKIKLLPLDIHSAKFT